MQIFLRYANGNGVSIEINQNQSILSNLNLFSQIQLENKNNFKILYRGLNILSIDKSLKDLNIKQNSILHLVVNEQKSNSSYFKNKDIKIFYENEIYTFMINQKQTISKLKNRIFESIKIHPKYQSLFFRGKRLQENLTIRQQNLQNQSLITLIQIKKPQNNNKTNLPFQKAFELFQNGTSLRLKKQIYQNKPNLFFRSDSLYRKNTDHCPFPQIQHKYTQYSNNVNLIASIQSQKQLCRLLQDIPVTQEQSLQIKCPFEFQQQIQELDKMQKIKLETCQYEKNQFLIQLNPQGQIDRQNSKSQHSLYQKLLAFQGKLPIISYRNAQLNAL